MTKTTKITIANATILYWNCERNTAYGNPVYRFTLTDETGLTFRGKTRPNAGFVYGLNYGPAALKDVVIAITPSGRVYMDDANNA